MKSLNGVIVFFAVLAVAGAGLFFFPQSPFYYKTLIVITDNGDEDASSSKTDIMAEEEEAEDIVETEEMSEEGVEASDNMVMMAEEPETEIDQVSDAASPEVITLSDRKLGQDDAPVKIIEFSSLSCGHCGNFHAEVYPEIKKNYIETGKVQLIMVDFPLNLPALKGSLLAHCLPEDQYFNFLQLLFTTQQNWMSGDFEANLKQNAQLAGLSSSDVDACLGNKDLEEQIVSRMKEASEKWEVSSTPSFIINDGFEKVEGNRPYEEFSRILDRALNKAEE